MIKAYRVFISPLLRPSCRHIPTCSTYALAAYKKYPFFEATFLSVRRILRCNPLFKGGYDPLPENFSFFNRLKKAK
ncbi:MAG: membrane protein insertion efficiency factor YidD [Exilispira sp.]|jgi:putative membrane protein insertion efficiency factor|nr:membrane protein insertion efficiency factor YidD [Exilispira sp.]